MKRKLAIQVKNLSKTFKVGNKEIKAVNDISFDIYKEEFVGFIGQNGAGKTTTLKCLTGLLVQDSGEVEVLGYIPQKRDYDFLERISLVMGNKSQLWWELPAIDTFLLNKEIYQIEDKEFEENLNEMVKILGVEELIQVPVRKLSLGERMKCELIASLLHSPELLFLDEPTLGLDVVSQQRLRDFLEEYHKRKKATVILTSHNMEDIKNLCKRVIMIDKGKILYDGRLSELTEKFVKEKFVHFVLPEVHQEKEISGLGKVLEFNGTTGLMLVDRGKIKEVTKVLIDKFDVEDIDIEEPTLESVVKNIWG